VEKLPWRTDRHAFLELAGVAEYDWGAAWKDESWAVIEEQLERLKAHRDTYGFEVVIVVFPVSYQVYADFVEATPQIRMKQEAEAFGFRYLDLLPVLRPYSDTDLFYDQCHPRPAANDIIGKAIAGFLREEVLDAGSNR
jgi:hypothetical protein